MVRRAGERKNGKEESVRPHREERREKWTVQGLTPQFSPTADPAAVFNLVMSLIKTFSETFTTFISLIFQFLFVQKASINYFRNTTKAS